MKVIGEIEEYLGAGRHTKPQPGRRTIDHRGGLPRCPIDPALALQTSLRNDYARVGYVWSIRGDISRGTGAILSSYALGNARRKRADRKRKRDPLIWRVLTAKRLVSQLSRNPTGRTRRFPCLLRSSTGLFRLLIMAVAPLQTAARAKLFPLNFTTRSHAHATRSLDCRGSLFPPNTTFLGHRNKALAR